MNVKLFGEINLIFYIIEEKIGIYNFNHETFVMQILSHYKVTDIDYDKKNNIFAFGTE